jgi:lipopolysaccharide export system permease protein
VGLPRICAPYLAVGLLLSLGVFAMNEYLAPDSAMKEKQIMNRHKDAAVPAGAKALSDLNFINSRDGRVWHGRIDLKSPQLTITDPRVFFSEQGTNFWLFANSGERLHDTWTFYDVQMKAATNATAHYVPVFSTNVLEMKQFSETPDEIRREVKFAQRQNQLSADISEIPVAEILDYLDLHPHDLPDQKRRSLYTQLHGRLASPWTSLVVVLIAIPFGAASGRRNIFVGVAGSIVICFVYFVLLKLGLAMGTGGYLPPWLAAWLPNITFGITGFWLMLRVR